MFLSFEIAIFSAYVYVTVVTNVYYNILVVELVILYKKYFLIKQIKIINLFINP